MTASAANPYQSPQVPATASESPDLPTYTDWKSILKRWELLRIPYNVVVGLAGLLTLALFPPSLLPEVAVDAVLYGLIANAMYLLGPVTELYLNWFVEAWSDRLVPKPAARFVRSRYTTILLFLLGSAFSVGLTLIIGLAEASAAGMPGQQ